MLNDSICLGVDAFRILLRYLLLKLQKLILPINSQPQNLADSGSINFLKSVIKHLFK